MARAFLASPTQESTKNLTAWERLTHLLLISNEAAFVD
jgi:hypothetical protein